MGRIGRFRKAAFLFVLLSALANVQTSAFDECDGLDECEWCDSGSPCFVYGQPDDCDQWDHTAAPCNFSGRVCQGGKVECSCTLCS
jgi:hypothetical protein